MDIKILIATPKHSFGEQIFQAFQEAGYYPLLVPGIAEAAFVIRDEKCPIAILDCQMSEPGTAYLATELRSRIEDLRIAFIHQDDCNGTQIEIDPARDIVLPQPFFLPDLLEVINLWAAEKKTSHESALSHIDFDEIPPELAWLKDVNRAAQYLTRLSLEANAQAALIIHNAQIWAYAGELPQTAAEELANFIGHYWANGDGSDLARFVRLDTTGSEYMLYATNLGADFVLALSFETEMPFSEMRAQTGKLARKLTSPLPELPTEIVRDSVPAKQPQPIEIDDYSPADWVPEDELATEEAEDQSMDEDLLERQRVMFEDLLATLDIPDPDGVITSPVVQVDSRVENQTQETETSHKSNDDAPVPAVTEPSIDASPLTRTEVQFEPESPAIHDLAYTCVLIPRLPEHHLAGVLTGLLNVEVMRLCLAFGWRLEHIAIRPQSLQWVVSVGPDVAAANVIRKIREQTSALLFEEFPRLAKENPSGDFWAPGFIAVHGRRSIASSLVDEFIQQTRTRQGLDKSIIFENLRDETK